MMYADATKWPSVINCTLHCTLQLIFTSDTIVLSRWCIAVTNSHTFLNTLQNMAFLLVCTHRVLVHLALQLQLMTFMSF